jgi:hypothetical protein
MAELSGFWTTEGTSPVGHQQASYTQAHWSTAGRILAACGGFDGVGSDYLNQLAVSVTGANTVQVATGGGVCDGKWYLNDAAKSINIPSAVGGGNTRYDIIVLRADWANFQVTAERVAGTDAASPSKPVLTQTSGTTFEILLAVVLVDTSGNCTVTDERYWAAPMRIYARVGGHATSWNTVGTTIYYPTKAVVVVGVTSVDFGTTDLSKTVNVTGIPNSLFYDSPIIYLSLLSGTVGSSGNTGEVFFAQASKISGGLSITVYRNVNNLGTAPTVYIQWQMIGPVRPVDTA